MATSLFSSLSAPTTEFSDPTLANPSTPGSTSSMSSSSTRQRGEDNTMKPLCRAYRPPLCSAPNQLSEGSLSSTSFPSTAIFNDMAKKGPVAENPQSLAKLDEEDEKEGSSSDWSSPSEIHNLGALKPFLFFWLHHLASVDKHLLTSHPPGFEDIL
ncbi:unnamed protein product [Linum trigynum]|uniref:Uncharacterized protein n=1 Tax=Linum trigynum TaxID=586398 RepID=A0AAV2GU34_9ROSI